MWFVIFCSYSQFVTRINLFMVEQIALHTCLGRQSKWNKASNKQPWSKKVQFFRESKKLDSKLTECEYSFWTCLNFNLKCTLVIQKVFLNTLQTMLNQCSVRVINQTSVTRLDLHHWWWPELIESFNWIICSSTKVYKERSTVTFSTGLPTSYKVFKNQENPKNWSEPEEKITL